MIKPLPAIPVTRGPLHHFFGYYDKPQVDLTGRYLLGHETAFHDRMPAAADEAVIGLIDTHEGFVWKPVARTRTWNWQQGAMLQWLPGAPATILYNDVAGAVVLNAATGQQRTLPRPVYAVTRCGRYALSLSFARLASTRVTTGYAGLVDPWEGERYPQQDGIWWMDLTTGDHRLIISYAQLANHRHDPSMERGPHWIEHVTVNPAGDRFLFLHRWPRAEGGFHTRMFTSDMNGGGLFQLPLYGASHFDWCDRDRILVWGRTPGEGGGYFLFDDRSDRYSPMAAGLMERDGHCTYSPDGRWVVTDEYPNGENVRTLILYDVAGGVRYDVGRFYSPPGVSGHIRCDLHPRWSRDGRFVTFDSVHGGTRQIYLLDVRPIVEEGSHVPG